MKINYIKITKTGIFSMLLLMGFVGFSQDVHFTFANGQNTNEDGFDYYEVDVMIQTINSTGSFKLGSGQLYFNYNTLAFGENVISLEGGLEVSYDGAICGEKIAGIVEIYGPFFQNNNIVSRVSWSFDQAISSENIPADNVTDVPAKLAHFKFKYTDVLEPPTLTFEDDTTFDDQFFTACGGGGSSSPNCTNFPGSQLVNDTFDSSGATLTINDNAALAGLSIYPNPTAETMYIKGDISQLQKVEIYSMHGQFVMAVKDNFREINIVELQSAVYFVKLYSENALKIIRIIKN